MRHYTLALLAAASMLICACAKEDQIPENIQKSVTATIDGGNLTRAAVRDVNVVWTDGDAIKVFNADGSASEVWNIRPADSGQESARFEYAGAPVLAVGEEAFTAFPAASVTGLAGKKLTMTLPETIAFDTQAVDEDDLVKTVIPMWATWGSSLTFHHLAAVIKVSFNNLPAGTTELILSSSTQHLSGTFTSGNLSETSLPKLTYSEGGSQSVSVTFPATTAAEDRTVFLPIPAGTYDLKLQARVGSELRDVKSWATREFARGKLYRAGINYVELTASSPADITDGLSTIADGEKVEINVVSAEAGGISTEDNATIAIPAIGGNASIGLTFSEPVVTPEGHPLVITDNCEGESAEAQNSLTITLPDATDVAMDLSLPTTTVALASSGTETVYKSITATTATNTLVIGHGVHIETLTINGGNVVMDGGRVDLLINNAEAGTTITATSSDQMIDMITSTHDLTLGSKETGSKLLTVGDMEVTAGAVTFIKCKATGIVTHTSSDMLKMTYSGSNYIERLNLDYGSAGVEVYGTVNKLHVYADGATVDCKYGSSGCGINFIQTMGQIKTLIWRTLNPGILSTVNYRVYIFRIETSSSNAQVFTLSDGGSVQVFELMKDINVFLTAEGRQSWGNPILAGDYDSIYYVQPEHSLPRWDTVVLTLDGEDGLYYGFADIKAAYEYAYWVKKNTVMNIKLNFDLYSKDYFTFGSGYDVTIDLNGRDLKFAGRYNFGVSAADQSKFYSNIYLFNGAKLTFTGSGKVTSDVETDAICYMKTNGAANTTLTFDGDAEFVAPTRVVWTERGKRSGTFYDGVPTCVVNAGTFSQQDHGGELFYVHSGELHVHGGAFNAEGNRFTLNCYDANRTSPDINQNTGAARIFVTGGRFYQFDPGNNLAEGTGTNFVPAGYISHAEDDWFVVEEAHPLF